MTHRHDTSHRGLVPTDQLGGAAFPASPTTGDVYFRTDLGEWYYYDGTRWLGPQMHMDLTTFSASTGLIVNDALAAGGLVTGDAVDQDIYIVAHRKVGKRK